LRPSTSIVRNNHGVLEAWSHNLGFLITINVDEWHVFGNIEAQNLITQSQLKLRVAQRGPRGS